MTEKEIEKIANKLKPHDVREYFAFFGGEESGIDLALASKIWDYAVDSVVVPKEKCTWEYDDFYSAYDTTCGEKYHFMEGTAQENGVAFCHKCGGKVVHIHKEEEE